MGSLVGDLQTQGPTLHCRQILYHLSHQRSPFKERRDLLIVLGWPFSDVCIRDRGEWSWATGGRLEIEVEEKHCLVLQKLFSCWFFIFSCHPMTFKFQSSAAILPINSLFCVSLLKFPPVTCQGQDHNQVETSGWVLFILHSEPLCHPSINLPSTKQYFSAFIMNLSSRHCPGC